MVESTVVYVFQVLVSAFRSLGTISESCGEIEWSSRQHSLSLLQGSKFLERQPREIFDHEDGQCLAAISHGDLVLRQPAYVQSRLPCDFFRNHQLTGKFLGQILQSTCHIDRIADCCEMNRGTVSHASNHCGSAVNADTDFERFIEFLRKGMAQVLDVFDHASCGDQCFPATVLRSGFDTEQSHHAVADKLVNKAAGAGDRLSHGLEIAVQQED